MTRTTLLPLARREPTADARLSPYIEAAAHRMRFEIKVAKDLEGRLVGAIECWEPPDWTPVWPFAASAPGVFESPVVDLSAAGSHRLGSAAVRVSFLVSGGPITFGVTATHQESDHV